MYCHDCNTANTVDSKYCKECGAKINDGYRTMMLSVQDLPVGQSEEAVDQLTRLLDMAFWHNEAGNVAAAITASEAALAINPNSTTAHSLLGSLYEKQGADAQAIQHFEAVLALNPDSAADATKLDQLRRGVHVKAAAPPISHQLVPPVLVKLGPTLRQKWAGLAETDLPRPGLQRQPLYAAGGVTAVVLLLGLLLTRPWASADAVTPRPAFPAPSAVGVNRSAFSGMAAAIPVAAPAPPLILQPNPASREVQTSSLLTTHDPFAGRGPATPSPAASPAWSLPVVPSHPVSARRRRQTGTDLPPLSLTALPPVGSEGGLAPAPVTLPAGIGGPLASVASIPQHTVVVSSFGGVGGGAPAQTDAPSHIRITVHQVSDTDANPIPVSSGDGQSDGGAKAASFQQSALSLQQAGQFKQARLTYQSAIRAYEAQIASGQDVETAQRGLAACQIGLQICQQSQ